MPLADTKGMMLLMLPRPVAAGAGEMWVGSWATTTAESARTTQGREARMITSRLSGGAGEEEGAPHTTLLETPAVKKSGRSGATRSDGRPRAHHARAGAGVARALQRPSARARSSTV